MKIYHSYWSKGYQKMDNFTYDMHKLSCLLALKQYGNITMICDKASVDYFKGIPYTNIEVFEKEVPLEYHRVWSLGKLFAFEQIANKAEPFLHIDYDVFLFKKLPRFITYAEIAVQNIETLSCVIYCYNVPFFEKECPNKHFLADIPFKNYYAWNMGIFGGNNLKAVRKYTDAVLSMVFDPVNYRYFTTSFDKEYTLSKTVIIEQLAFAMFAKQNNIEVVPLFNKQYPANEEVMQVGYCHLMSGKNNIGVKEKIKRQILMIENTKT